MKTRLTPGIVLMLASVSMIMASCTKEPTSAAPVNYPAPGSNLQTAAIQDLGTVDGTHRLMVVTLTNLDVLVNTSSYEEMNGQVGEVSFGIYTTEDGLVPSGLYQFNEGNEIQPFTFTYASLRSLNLSGSYLDNTIAGGALSVSQDATGYQFSFDCTLQSGEGLRGSFTGQASYEDVAVKK